MHPESLPDATQRAIFGFEPSVFPGLVLAACVEGNLSEVSANRVLPAKSTIQEIEAFIPDPHRVPRTSKTNQQSAVDYILKVWRQNYAPNISASTSTVPEWCSADDTLSPTNNNEQRAMVDYTAGWIQKHLGLQRVVWHNYERKDTPQAFSYIHATLLGTVSDIAAIPRIMAGMDFDRERSELTAQIREDYDIDQQGVISLRNDMQPSPWGLAESLTWKKPCEDFSPGYGPLGSIGGVYYVRRPLVWLVEVLGMVAEVAPERLLTPLDEADKSEFRSPFRANSYQLLKRALEVYGGDNKRVLDAFFAGEVIELPRGVYMDTRNTAKEREKLLADHQAIMQNLRENELGQQMIDLVTTGQREALEVKRADQLNPGDLSGFLSQRLKNIARILYDYSSDPDSITPNISLTESSSKLIMEILDDWWITALHLVPYPRNKPLTYTGISAPFHIGVIVESGKGRNASFSGVYFTIAMSDKVNYGVRKIKIKTGGPRMSEKAAHKLMRPPESGPHN